MSTPTLSNWPDSDSHPGPPGDVYECIARTPSKITSLYPFQVYVFLSNAAGRHSKAPGSKLALGWGAQHGRAEGRQGLTYALPVRDEHLEPLPLLAVEQAIGRLLRHVMENRHLTFLMPRFGMLPGDPTYAQVAAAFCAMPLPTNAHVPGELLDAMRAHNCNHAGVPVLRTVAPEAIS